MTDDFEIKGWCPGALRPMQSGDGLVVRVRLPMGAMTSTQAMGIAQAAHRHGNGQIEISNRANLQLRGVRDDSHRTLLSELAALGVLDSDLTAEARRNILISPFNLADSATMDLASELQSRLMELPELPAKFGHVIDIGATRVLAEASGDLRLERGVSGGMILRADGAALGQSVTAQDAVSALITLAHWFVDQGGITQGRGRMRGLIGQGRTPPNAVEAPVDATAIPMPGPNMHGCLVGFEFGSFPAETLLALGALGRPLRLTPWRMMLIEGMSDLGSLRDTQGIIGDPADPLLWVRACPGQPFCPQALGPTRDIARALAPRVPKGKLLHVSGCAKGCAHPTVSDMTLVARPGGFAMARNCKADQVATPAMPTHQFLQNPDLFDAKGPL